MTAFDKSDSCQRKLLSVTNSEITTHTSIESLVSVDDEFFCYLDPSSMTSCQKALDDLESYIVNEGPFDAVMAFSQGAGLVASLMVRKIRQEPEQQRVKPLFKCAVFFSGGEPCDPGASTLRTLNYQSDGEIIDVPTAHIWGQNDRQYPTFGPVLSRLCKSETRTTFVHGGGHELPGLNDKDEIASAVRIIKRTIERSTLAQ